MPANAIVVMFDSLQFNYLGCYGNDWIKTPNFDRFAREGVLFENCYIEGVPTIPCRRAMHTGRYTLPEGGWRPLSMADTTIADLCWGRPIDTALVFDCPMYRQPKFGYTRGFDKVWFIHGHELDYFYFERDPLYHLDPMDYISDSALACARERLGDVVINGTLTELDCYLRDMQHWKSEEDRFVARTMKNAVKYLEQVDRNKQFFLWVDSFDPHEPWNSPSVYMDVPCPYDPDYRGKDDFLPFAADCEGLYSEEQLRHIRALYAELVTVCDRWFGHLLEAVRRLGFEENTLLMMVSDHGEPMGHGEHGHGIMRKVRPWPYEELVHAPLILRGPGLPAGRRVAAFVQSVDVAPTLCEWLGMGAHPDMQGKSLLPLARGEADKVRDFAVAGYHRAGWALYTEDWSYVHWPLNDKSTAAFLQDMTAQQKDGFAAVGRKKNSVVDADALAGAGSALSEYKKTVTLDGEEQWTCTPGAAYLTPEQDELYDRRADPFQLRNVIREHPDLARKLLAQLKDAVENPA